ncbi:IclR family transcriptional regulator [Acetohalobium arabaticum]|uniref:Glycerol operon regulatory protein n=1 Tax=Acetohalobium arabaticum (strain ATCC 49924 / DSM 5501 / Z-7288) TaxID=574087 RepID=D9QSS3_ACEAZ|nr:IclR family transcriptional regulator [Acetohalobium arabaticum]ADL11611.1 transcriptional regulator, IclR family [Acetohalobium arabaticum DSM 5501]
MAKKKVVQSVDRSLIILEALADKGKPMALSNLAEEIDLNISTVHRLLNTLRLRGFIEQEEDSGKYYLGLKTFEIGNAAKKNINLISIAKPYMQDLVDQCNETTNLAILDEGEVVYIEQVASTNMVKMFAQIGSRGPAYCTGTGKALLAYEDPDQWSELFAKMDFGKFTDNTKVDSEVLRAELKEIRQQGYAIDRGEMEEGVRCVAAPIKNHEGEVIAAVSVSGPSIRLTEKYIEEEVIETVVEIAGQISARLGYRI